MGSNSWSSRDDHWSAGGIADTHGHVSTYDNDSIDYPADVISDEIKMRDTGKEARHLDSAN
ncbi:unnamed protein product [Wuchereria bancrofti]|uniref:Uncharacterized protein n=1 Tax=Wuchereria bancrofti TaxID=6293 RepID=A0A3P7G5F1_WUCBA|nr:unnamed protein product [Wuchereria bancrofti]